MVSGKSPIPIIARELIQRRYTPILLTKILLNPNEKKNARIPQMTIPELKKNEETPEIPKSLNACFVQLNQGEYDSAHANDKNKTIGINIPQTPPIRVCFLW